MLSAKDDSGDREARSDESSLPVREEVAGRLSNADGATWGFRLLILPGAAALWPVLLSRWLRAGSDAQERSPHRDAAFEAALIRYRSFSLPENVEPALRAYVFHPVIANALRSDGIEPEVFLQSMMRSFGS